MGAQEQVRIPDFFAQPILNLPYEYPGQHWELDADRLPTNRVIPERRKAEFIAPIPKPKRSKTKGQKELNLDATGVSTAEHEYNPSEKNQPHSGAGHGLVTQYPDRFYTQHPTFTCFGQEMYEQALSEEQQLEFSNQAAILVEEYGRSSREPCLYEEDPYEYELPEKLESVRNPVITKSIELPIGIDQVLQQQAQTQLLDSARQLALLSLPRPLRQNLVEVLKYLEQIIKDYS